MKKDKKSSKHKKERYANSYPLCLCDIFSNKLVDLKLILHRCFHWSISVLGVCN